MRKNVKLDITYYVSSEFITYTPVEEVKDEDFVFSNELKEISKLLLHQKVNNTQEIIGYPPNK